VIGPSFDDGRTGGRIRIGFSISPVTVVLARSDGLPPAITFL
jgi:hypothetical protein